MVQYAMQPMPQILYDAPEIEYLDGRPHPKLSPKSPHAIVQLAVGILVRDCGRGLGKTGSEWRFRPDASSTEFVPDVAFVSNDRLRVLQGRDRDEPPFSPDIAIEIRSPGDNIRYLREKIRRYLGSGSVLVLDVDARNRRIHAYSADGVREYDSDSTFEHAAAPWLRFEIADAFTDLDD
jgi:Uma2 family endonuclease